MSHYESERRTRNQRIDPKLEAACWEIVPHEEGRPLSDYTCHAITAKRVDVAMVALAADRQFTPKQQSRLNRIRARLIENLSIDRDDFDVVPVFHDAGGWGKANKVFEGQLSGLLKEINQAIAA